MAMSDSIQTLVAAFGFGILLQASAGALFIYYSGHGSQISQDGRRLVLILFLLFSTLWSTFEFINLLISPTAAGACQGTLVVSTLFDQLARVALEQFLLWSIGHGTRVTAERLILQVILLARLVMGGVLVGFTRPEFAPTCVAKTSLLPISIVVLSLDALIIGVLIVRSMSLGMFEALSDEFSTSRRLQSRALLCSIGGLSVWTGTSVPMILGIPSIMLMLRTVLPSAGLLVLIAIIVMFTGNLLLEMEEDSTTPESQSPFVMPIPPSRDMFEPNVRDNGSPISGHHRFSKAGNLFVVNPSNTPRDGTTPTSMFHGSRGDTKGFTKMNDEVTITVTAKDDSSIKRGPGNSGSGGVFQGIIAQGQTQGFLAPQVVPSIIRTDISGPTFPAAVATQKRGLFNWSKPPPKVSVRSLGISQPLAVGGGEEDSNRPFARMPTIDLATAANNERMRREGVAARAQVIQMRPSAQGPLESKEEGLKKSVSVIRKQAPVPSAKSMPKVDGNNVIGLSFENSTTTSAQRSPGNEVRRRSPRSKEHFEAILDEKQILKPALVRKPSGLPSNPKAQGIRMAQDNSSKRPTVMFMKDIVYDNPAMVEEIIKDAPGQYAASRKSKPVEKSYWSPTSVQTLKSTTGSVIHRPRPVKRNPSNQDRESLLHRRSRSGSSLPVRKSMLFLTPGSPSNLPPLPAPPSGVSDFVRVLPNNTKSMTFNEKIDWLFPMPPSSSFSLASQKRRSSVPSLPKVPSVFMSDSPVQSPNVDKQSFEEIKRQTMASFKDFVIPVDMPKKPSANAAKNHQTYRFSANTYLDIAEKVAEKVADTWLPPAKHISPEASKSLLPVPRLEDERTDSMSYRPSMQTEGEELMFMLDSEEKRSTFIADLDLEETRKSFFLDEDQELLEDAPPLPRKREPSWHKRIGDELPTFSERQMKARSIRKMPPPPPLLLSKNGRQTKVVVRNREPSPPPDSPERAIKELEDQLKRFEEPTRGSVGSLLSRIPGAAAEPSNDRARLLQNLEAEMGLQEDQWKELHTKVDRDSMSQIMTPQASEPSEPSLSRENSMKNTHTQSRAISRRSRIRSNLTVRSKSQDSDSSVSSSENSRASVWQQRLAEAQMEYIDKAPALVKRKSVNFLSAAKMQVMSPTPPGSIDSDETDFESGSETEENTFQTAFQMVTSFKRPAHLWQPQPASPKAAIGRMWSHPQQPRVSISSLEPPARNLRPAQRRTQSELSITSKSLWTKARSFNSGREFIGLWGSKVVRPKSLAVRRKTHRPMRKSKRVTYLPDIVESPQPLPDKSNTLGVFQFPWGEISDQPVYQPAFPAVVNPLLSSTIGLKPTSQRSDQTEYSSSFFDDYEDEDDDGDDFDETTLWEIANLLHTEDVPSKNNRLQSRRQQVIEDYDNEDESGDVVPIGLNMEPLALTAKIVQVKKGAMLWAGEKDANSNTVSKGLPQPAPQAWESMISSSEDAVRPKARPAELMPTLESVNLWTAATPAAPKPVTAMWSNTQQLSQTMPTMWTIAADTIDKRNSLALFSVPTSRLPIRTTKATPAAVEMVKSARQLTEAAPKLTTRNLWSKEEMSRESIHWTTKPAAVPVVVSKLMWAPAAKTLDNNHVGLFDASVFRSTYRTTEAEPAAIDTIRKARESRLPLAKLVSTKLWRGCQKLPIERDWISESSVRPESPSIYSPISSSGGSTPVSDSSSVKSSSTKASSLWGTVGGWWSAKGSPAPSSRSPKNVTPERPSKLPVRQKSLKSKAQPLTPVRESRVLASRDLWEARAPVLEKPRAGRFSVAQKPVIPEVAAHVPLRKLHRPAVAFRADWEAALAEAIAAGKPEVGEKEEEDWDAAVEAAWKILYLHRERGTPEIWESDLAEAIAKGSGKTHRSRGTTTMWAADLAEAVAKSAKTDTYDASVLHPVFFTKKLISNAVDIHPAALGYVTRKNLMWNAASVSTSQQEIVDSGLWSATTAHCQDIFSHVKGANSQKAVARREPIPRLNSSELFTPITKREDDADVHWLHKTSASKSMTLTWTASAPEKKAMTARGMWKVNSESCDLFENPHTQPWNQVKRSTAQLTELESQRMWRPDMSVPDSPKHWLVKRRFSRVEFRY